MTVYPLVVRVGPLTVTGYGLMMMMAFLVAGWVIQRELSRQGLAEDYAADIVVAAVIGGIIGGKLYYALLYQDMSSLLSRGGLVWYGGFLGGVSAVLFNGWRRRVPMRFTMELAAPALAVGYALGRVGCFLVQDDYGLPSSMPWALRFPEGWPPSTVQYLSRDFGLSFPPGMAPTDVLAVHPTQLYETTLMLAAFWWLWRLRGHGHAVGWLFGVYLVLAGTERFVIEFFRAKDDRFFGPLTVAQVVSIILVTVGVVLMSRWSRNDGFSLPTDVKRLFQRTATAAAKS
ncbi:MAG TPA: prolipoprotein diacylglyceryl transferase [Gemmatimonadales bacterium]|nr:prolipoprotein diacylglyceryl transferase [Gemmatimonadales bacterium]